MMAKTIQERLAQALTSRGHKELHDRVTRKYRVFFRHYRNDGVEMFFFLGKSGALRTGRNVTDSISLEHSKLRAQLLEEVQ